jgi:hypothetical protein
MNREDSPVRASRFVVADSPLPTKNVIGEAYWTVSVTAAELVT